MKRKPLTPEQKEAKRLYDKERNARLKDKIKEYYEINKNKIKQYQKERQHIINEQQKERRKNNPIKNKEYQNNAKQYQKNYHETNKERLKQQQKEYQQKNKEKISEHKKIYTIKNKDKINQIFRDRRKNDNLFRIKQDCRNMLNKAFKRFNKPQKTEQILGCTFEEFKIYLENKFESWMAWENKGLYNGTENYGWDIDHIVPLDTAESINDIIRLNHYTNLQPLCSHINRNIKKNKI